MADVLVVDRKGLAKKLEKRPKSFILFELLQNAWDENVTQVTVTATMLKGQPLCRITVEDDCPEGFADIRSVYTLFRDSKKAPDPTKRGRFELGEKLVLALAIGAMVETTKGTVVIEGNERRETRHSRKAGTLFTGDFRMTREEFAEVCEQVRMLLVPEGIETTFNGERLLPRKPLHTFRAFLQTVRVDDEGNLKPTERKTDVRVYEVAKGEEAHIYEMGIPVVATGDRWHYDIQQRVPVNWERNNVPPSYLKTLRVEVLNAMHAEVPKTEATATWVTDAIEDSRCEAPALAGVVQKRFGEKAVIFDPSDSEGTKIAMSQGYTVIPGGALPKGAWENVRKHRVVLPAGQVTPSPKPYDPNGRTENVIPMSKWTPDMWRISEFARELFKKLTDSSIGQVVITNESKVSWLANFGPWVVNIAGLEVEQGMRLCLNYGRLGDDWFKKPKRDEAVLALLIHEFGHHFSLDHLSSEYHDALCKLGSSLAQLALEEPSLFAE